MYVLKCIKPGLCYGTNVKQGMYLASNDVKWQYTSNLNKAMLFKKQADAKWHLQSILHGPEISALFCAYAAEIREKK